jgi:hypothetical protein
MNILPPFKFPNEPIEPTEAEWNEFTKLKEELSEKRFKTTSELDAYMEFAPEFQRYKELRDKTMEYLSFQMSLHRKLQLN